MVRITKVYTKTGDKGMTRLAGGQSISKGADRIETYGTIDELNAVLGLCVESLKPDSNKLLNPFVKQLLRLQNELFDLGTMLAVLAEDRQESTPEITDTDTTRLEKEIDEMNEDLPILKSFILPGGGELSARLHLARTVCRRAERLAIRLSDTEKLDPPILPYLNRLSDWFFVASRFVSHQQNIEETLWEPGKR